MNTICPEVDQAVMVNILKNLVSQGMINRREAEETAAIIAAKNGAKFFAVI